MSSIFPSEKRDNILDAAPDSLPGTTRSNADHFALKAEIVPFLFCTGVGLLVAILPHLVWWPTLGRPFWISDPDELQYYLPAISAAFYAHPFHLADVAVPTAASAFPWMQFVPTILLTKLLHLDPSGAGLVWRIIAGAGMGAAAYGALRALTGTKALAAATCVIFLTDSGARLGQPLARTAQLCLQVLTGRASETLNGWSMVQPMWRLITPAVSLPFLLLFVWLFYNAILRPTRGRTILAVVGFGLLFYVYFFFWTAAGAGLLLGVLFDRKHRRLHFTVGAVGTILGLPQLTFQALINRKIDPGWFERNDYFVHVPRSVHIPMPMGMLLLAALTGIWVLWRQREFLFLWLFALPGLALYNHQVISGISIENLHYSYYTGPLLMVLFLTLGVREALRPWPLGIVVRRGIIAVAVVIGIAGLWLRYIEATRQTESRKLIATYQQFIAQDGLSDRPRLPAVIAGDTNYVNWAVALRAEKPLSHEIHTWSTATSSEEWNRRTALNGLLRGETADEFSRNQDFVLGFYIGSAWFLWEGDPVHVAQQKQSRMRAYEEFSRDLEGAIAHYDVHTVALPRSQQPPAYLQHGWTRTVDGPSWQLWERL